MAQSNPSAQVPSLYHPFRRIVWTATCSGMLLGLILYIAVRLAVAARHHPPLNELEILQFTLQWGCILAAIPSLLALFALPTCRRLQQGFALADIYPKGSGYFCRITPLVPPDQLLLRVSELAIALYPRARRIDSTAGHQRVVFRIGTGPSDESQLEVNCLSTDGSAELSVCSKYPFAKQLPLDLSSARFAAAMLVALRHHRAIVDNFPFGGTADDLDRDLGRHLQLRLRRALGLRSNQALPAGRVEE